MWDILICFSNHMGQNTYLYHDEMLKQCKTTTINRACSASMKCIMGNLTVYRLMQHIYYRTM